MMWVCRPGQQARYLSKFIDSERIYLAWDGYAVDFRSFGGIDDLKRFISKEKKTENRTSIANWSG